jgi:hypothetical protein
MERLRNMQRAQRIAHLETGEPDRVHDVVTDLVAHEVSPRLSRRLTGLAEPVDAGRLTSLRLDEVAPPKKAPSRALPPPPPEADRKAFAAAKRLILTRDLEQIRRGVESPPRRAAGAGPETTAAPGPPWP